MKRHVMRFALGLGAFVAATSMVLSGADDKPKYTIAEVMEKAHKGGLLKKVVSGMATKQEKDELVIGYTALALNKPPKGDAASWKEKTEALVKAAKAVAKDDKDKAAIAELKKASNCKACHTPHKGS